jgi:ribosomal protein S18 acetylase RimI-like enzyme
VDALTIRRLAPADLVDYKSLRDESLAAHPESFTSDPAPGRTAESYLPRLGLQRPEGGEFTLGAWRSGKLLGAVTCERDARAKVRHIGHLIGMMVRADAQGQGLGRALLDACIAQARASEGLVMLTLSVTAGNGSAVHLYERAGFVRYGSLQRAIRVDGVYHAKDQMVLAL